MNEYIRISDRPPDKYTDVDVVTTGGNKVAARYTSHKGHFEFVDSTFKKVRGVSKWKYNEDSANAKTSNQQP